MANKIMFVLVALAFVPSSIFLIVAAIKSHNSFMAEFYFTLIAIMCVALFCFFIKQWK